MSRVTILFIFICCIVSGLTCFTSSAKQRFFQDRGVDWLGDTLVSTEVRKIFAMDSLFILSTSYGYETLFPTDSVLYVVEKAPTVFDFRKIRGRYSESKFPGDSILYLYGPTERRTFDLLKRHKNTNIALLSG